LYAQLLGALLVFVRDSALFVGLLLLQFLGFLFE
jgi:hypothetical protein